MAVNNTSLFAAGNIAFSSLNDVFAQANVYGSSVTGNQNLLVLTPTGVKELTRGGTAVSNLALLSAGYQVRGITMDRSGLIYGVSDNGNAGINSALLIYAPAAVPEPEGDGLGLGLALGLGALFFVTRRKKTKAPEAA